MIILLALLMMVSGQEIYSVNHQFQISSQVSQDELAHIVFYSDDRRTGWNRLYLYANYLASPIDQHRAAGFLEGYTTYSQIHSAFLNFVELDFGGKQFAPEKVQLFLDKQLQYMDAMIQNNKDNIFWKYAEYYLQQVRYMHAGYQTRVKRQKLTQLQLTFKQFYYLTSVGDLEDLLPLGQNEDRKNCNAYIKIENSTLYITHGTHNRYSFLLRIFKTWNFPRQDVPLQSTSFTSRPGDLISKDDFFILSSGLRVLETSLQNKNPKNLEELRYTTAPSWLRTLIANHLSSSIQDWIKYFTTERSGTHNNQWIIIDPSKVKSKDGIVVFLEEAFSIYRVVDMTTSLLKNGFVGGYNMPVSEQIYNKLGYIKESDRDYSSDPRALILAKYHLLMTTEADMKYWLITNEEQFAYAGLAPRYDQLEQNPRAFGMTDCKILSPNTEKQGYFWAISGPPTSNGRFPPFDWKKWPKVPHYGLQQIFDFDWQKIPLNVEQNEVRHPLSY